MGKPATTNDIFEVGSVAHNEGVIDAALNINKESAIFKGHFPGQPIVPGACMLQVVKDVLEIVLDGPLRLKKAGQIKFLNKIDPESQLSVQLIMNYKLTADDGIQTTAQLFANETVCFKFKGVFIAD